MKTGRRKKRRGLSDDAGGGWTDKHPFMRHLKKFILANSRHHPPSCPILLTFAYAPEGRSGIAERKPQLLFDLVHLLIVFSISRVLQRRCGA